MTNLLGLLETVISEASVPSLDKLAMAVDEYRQSVHLKFSLHDDHFLQVLDAGLKRNVVRELQGEVADLRDRLRDERAVRV